MSMTRDEVAQFLRDHVVDTRQAVDLLGVAGRSTIGYMTATGRLTPAGTLNGGHVFARGDVLAYGAERARQRHERKGARK